MYLADYGEDDRGLNWQTAYATPSEMSVAIYYDVRENANVAGNAQTLRVAPARAGRQRGLPRPARIVAARRPVHAAGELGRRRSHVVEVDVASARGVLTALGI